MDSISSLTNAMIEYYAGDPRRISHFLKVHGFARTIGELEDLDDATQMILEVAALTHDIGIRSSELKHGSSAGSWQQIEGPPEAEMLLTAMGFAPGLIDRVCWLIAHHHTYNDIQGLDYQILIEADFLVNAYEDGLTPEAVRHGRDKLFRTAAGISILNAVFKF